MSYLDDLKAALARNADRAAEIKSVDNVPGLGTLYVRPRLVSEINATAVAQRNGEINAVALGIARVLCNDSGERFTDAEQEELAGLLAGQPESVLFALSRAADSDSEAQAEGNSTAVS